ncbi:hypothetical protein Hanom_Chr15g01396721 [Helianthus anomalus]
MSLNQVVYYVILNANKSLHKNMGYGRGLAINAQITISGGCGLAINARVTTPGGLGFERGPLVGTFSPGVGRVYQYDMVGSQWPKQLAVGLVVDQRICAKKFTIKLILLFLFTTSNQNTLQSSIIISIQGRRI